MPESKRTARKSAEVNTSNGKRLTLAELVALRQSIPPPPSDKSKTTLSERFLLPPFTVLDARQGYWQKRKKMWYDTGLVHAKFGSTDNTENLLGFSDTVHAAFGGKLEPNQKSVRKRAAAKSSGASSELANGFKSAETASLKGELTFGTTIHPYDKQGASQLVPGGASKSTKSCWPQDGVESQYGTKSGTSIFDPVLCEIALRWFCPKGGRVLDPFAGGTSLGVVSGMLGYNFTGVEVRQDQVDANNKLVSRPDIQWKRMPKWACHDSATINQRTPGGMFDFVCTDPPYFTLEKYSHDQRDGSTSQDYKSFLAWYSNILQRTASVLKNDRFFLVKIGEVRDRDGNYVNIVGDTVRAMQDAGLHYYNEACLVTAVGSLPIRIGAQFTGYRKLGRTHQSVLVFLKGDAGRATKACGDVDLDNLVMPAPKDGTIMVCGKDVMGTSLVDYLEPDAGNDTHIVELPILEACMLVDVIRGQAREKGELVPRVWVGTKDKWVSVDTNTDLTYIVGGVPYLSREVFPNAKVPMDTPPTPKRFRG